MAKLHEKQMKQKEESMSEKERKKKHERNQLEIKLYSQNDET